MSTAVFAANSGQKPASPDVLVLVLSGVGPGDQVAINYAAPITKEAVQADIAQLQKQTGWSISAPVITTKQTTPQSKPTTSARFGTIRVVDMQNGTFPLSPLVTTLRRYRNLQLMFITPAEFRFRGLKDFANDYVKIKLESESSPYRYAVVVKSDNFTQLQLPLRQPRPAPERQSSPVGPKLLLVLGLAIICSVAAYLVAARFSGRGARNS